MKHSDHQSLASIVLLEAHRYVDYAADVGMKSLDQVPSVRPPVEHEDLFASITEMKHGTQLAYPPNDEARFTDEELSALAQLRLPPAARSGLRKVIRSAASLSLFQLFCLLDAVADPQLTSVDPWLPVNFGPNNKDVSREMMHDEFTASFWRYHKGAGGRR
jgi:hypothetical protein